MGVIEIVCEFAEVADRGNGEECTFALQQRSLQEAGRVYVRSLRSMVYVEPLCHPLQRVTGVANRLRK